MLLQDDVDEAVGRERDGELHEVPRDVGPLAREDIHKGLVERHPAVLARVRPGVHELGQARRGVARGGLRAAVCGVSSRMGGQHVLDHLVLVAVRDLDGDLHVARFVFEYWRGERVSTGRSRLP